MSYGSKRRLAKAIATLLSVGGIGLVLVPLAAVVTTSDYLFDREVGGVGPAAAWLLVVGGSAWAAGHSPKVSGRKVVKPRRVRRHVRTVAWAGLLTLCMLPGGVLWPVGAALVSALVARAMGRAVSNAYGWVSWAAVLSTAAGMAWRRDRPLVLAAAAAAVLVGAVLSASGVWAAGALAALLALAPARLHRDRAAAVEQTRTEVGRSLAGVLTGSSEWEPELAATGWAPVTVDVGDDLAVREVVLPLPPTWHGSRESALAEEVERRLAPWSEQGWRVRLEQGRASKGAAWWAHAVPRPPAPLVAWSAWPAAQLSVPPAYADAGL